ICSPASLPLPLCQCPCQKCPYGRLRGARLPEGLLNGSRSTSRLEPGVRQNGWHFLQGMPQVQRGRCGLMALYDRPVRLLMRDMADDLLTSPTAMITTQQAVSWFRAKYPKVKPGTITAHLRRLSTNAPSRTYYGATK